MLRLNHLARASSRFATFDADLTVVGAGPGGYVAAIKDRFFLKFKIADKKDVLPIMT